MKKLLAMLLAALLLITSMSIVTWADDDDLEVTDSLEGADPGPRFYSVGEIIEYRNYLRETDEDHGAYYEVYDCLESLEGLYLPEGYTLGDVTQFMAGTYFYYVYLEHDGKTVLFTYYYDISVTDILYTPKLYARTGEYSGKTLETSDGTTVYFYNFAPTYKTTISEDLEYWWYQDGYYYSLRLMGSHDTSETGYEELYGDELLEMCNATYHPFSEAYNLTSEATDGKVSLSWDEIVDDSTTLVYYKRSTSDTWLLAGTTSKHKVNIRGLTSGISYDFKIESAGGESDIVTVVQ